MKKIIGALLFLSCSVIHAQTYTHNVYVHKAGIDTSIYQTRPVQMDPKPINDLVEKIKLKREARQKSEREAQYATDLISTTDGLKNISQESILPLIQKYPEKSSDLINLLEKNK